MLEVKYCLEWQNITVEIGQKQAKPKKIVLDNVSGRACSKSLTAIMGTSGSGKTTLLGAISGLLEDKKGSVKINGRVVTSSFLRKISGYIHQTDIFFETLTVMEHLKFMAAFHLRKSSEEKREIKIKKWLQEIGLENQTNTQIRHLSGGEKRRLSLTTQLLNNPLILFCDEPTTGLDSYNAIKIVQNLKQLALSDKMILTTIHQPSSQLFNIFDNFILLAGGKLIFCGSQAEAKSVFESVSLYCPAAYNPADFYIKCVNENDLSGFGDVFQKRGGNGFVENNVHFDDLENKDDSFFYEVKWLVWRSSIEMKRNAKLYMIGYFLLMVEGLGLALVYSFVDVTDSSNVQNIQGLLFSIISELGYTNMYAVIYVFPSEISVFLREKALYSSHSYFFSKLLTMLPICIFSTLSYCSLFFILLQFLSGFGLWLKFTYMMFLTGMVSYSLGLAVSAIFSHVEYMDLILGPMEMLFMILSGFWVKIGSVWVIFEWIKYLSPFYYGFSSVSNLFWNEISSQCTRNQTVPCYGKGNEVLNEYGISGNSLVTVNILYLHILTLVFCFIGFLGIFCRRKMYSSY